MKLYRDILRSSWNHTIHRPGLWVFGFFATLLLGASGELDRYLRFMNAIVADGNLLNPKSWLDGHWINVVSDVWNALQQGNVYLWLLLIGGVVAAGLVCLMMAISVGALIHSAKHSTETFTAAFQAGYKHWLQLSSLFVCAYVLVTVGTLATVTAVLYAAPTLQFEQAHLLAVLVAGIIFIPLVVIVSFILRLATMHIVLDNQHLGKAIQSAWQLLRSHWLVVLEMSIVSYVVVSLISLALLLGLLIMFVPYFLGIAVDTSGSAGLRLQNALYVGQWVYLILSLFSASVLSTWQWSAWTTLFETFRHGQPDSTLVRWIRSVK